MSKLAKALTAAAGNAGESLYVEDVFSTYLYAGTGTDQTITNGINLSEEGGLVWLKNRGPNYTGSHTLYDTERGGDYRLETNSTAASGDVSGLGAGVTFNTDGFVVKGNYNNTNRSGDNAASWTFRKAEKFFDVVTYTGDGASSRYINHNLGANAGAIFIKRTDSASDWTVQHRYNNNYNLYLNSTSSQSDSGATNRFNDTDFTVIGSGLADSNKLTNISGATYVAYLFASDAGGFGDDGSESIIKCGSYTGNGGTQEINLGFEPQWLLVKSSTQVDSWFLTDTMRGMPNNAPTPYLLANLSNAEADASAGFFPQATATGFKIGASGSVNASGQTFIYIAIRRPMKTPESGTEVFKPSFRITGDPTVDTGFVTDMGIVATRTGGGTSDYHLIGSRLTGNLGMTTTSTSAEVSRGLEPLKWDYNDGWGGSDTASSFAVWYSFKRATGFFDVACHTSDGVTESYPHNLGVIPELKIIKNRGDGTVNWVVGGSVLGAPTNRGYYLYLNDSSAMDTNETFFDQNDTASVYGVRSNNSSAGGINNNSYVVYLFATLAGVSKVGSYTGDGNASQNIDCGFASGARFVLIKSTNAVGSWFVFDTARGIVAGNDSRLELNATSAEVTSADVIDPYSAGFAVTNNSIAINVLGREYIFLAIA